MAKSTNKSYLRSFLELNLGLIFISTSGVIGRVIKFPIPLTIQIRCVIAAIILFSYCKIRGVNLKVKKNHIFLMLVAGIFMGMHWVFYFQSLYLSNVATGLLSLYIYPIVTGLLEPLVFKKPFEKIHLLLGLIVLIGLYVLNYENGFSFDKMEAILWGALSGLTYAIRNLIVKVISPHYEGTTIMFYQLVVVSFALIPFFAFNETTGFIEALPYIAFLALITTVFGHTLFVLSLKRFTPTSQSLMSSALPLYGIILGMIFIDEIPSIYTIIGGTIIMSTVLIEALRIKKNA